MISLKCKNCGGEMSVDGSGSLYCDYCGSKYAFQDDELLQYRNFRMQVLNYLRGVHDQKANGEDHEDLLWGDAETVLLQTADGTDVTIRYLYSFDGGAAVTYLTRNSVLYVFPEKQRGEADKMLQGIQMLTFPPADVKGLGECFPSLVGKYELKDGGIMLAFERPTNMFPLSMFGSLAPRHVAWIVSRMENICCVLEYSGITHGGISEETVFINPFIHHAVLYGHWWGARRKECGLSHSFEAAHKMPNQDLWDVRKMAERILGLRKEEAPAQFLQFLREKPAADAYADFEAWDRVIEEGFGGRRFARMTTKF